MSSTNKGQDDAKGEKSYDPSKVEELRAVIESSQVGGIIGKGGANIKKVRETTGAFVSILKLDSNSSNDRILLIKGTIAQQCDAIVAVCKLITEANASNENASKKDDSNNFEFKLLVHKAAVGAIIGKAGQSIKDTQAQTGAHIQISNDPLPGSTEKTVIISGSPSAVNKAAQVVLIQLRESPLHAGTQVIHYVPGQNLIGGLRMDNYLQQLSGLNLGFGVMNAGFGGRQGRGAAAAQQQGQQGQTQTHKLVVPTNCTGLIIGRQGATIRDIRNQSGCSISIAKSETSTPDERVVSILGSLAGINAAVYMIKTLVDTFQTSSARSAGSGSGSGAGRGKREEH